VAGESLRILIASIVLKRDRGGDSESTRIVLSLRLITRRNLGTWMGVILRSKKLVGTRGVYI
jgi:hypothetical protein